MAWSNLQTNLNIDISNFVKGLNKASNDINAFAATFNSSLNRATADPTKNVNKLNLGLKSNMRIVQGILVSKAFYTTFQNIRDAVTAVKDFNNELEYTQMIFTNMTGSSDIANNLISVLQDFAATTPFSFTEASDAAKRLLAYGIEYKNLMFVMKGVMQASTISGDPRTVESVSRAVGQIYTKGRLMNEEMRQLAEAGIPAYEILEKKLGLTKEQLQNLGKEGIASSIAINALMEGIGERYGAVASQASQTIRGMLSNIGDNALLIMEKVTKGLNYHFRNMISSVSRFMEQAYSIISTKGLGGLFESIVPKELQADIRLLIANLINLGRSIRLLIGSLGNIVKSLLPTFIMWLNVLLSAINPVINILAHMANIFATNASALKVLQTVLIAAAAAWVVFKIKALAAIAVHAVGKAINAVSNAVLGLANALVFLVTHPAFALFLGLAGVVLFLTGTFSKAASAARSFFEAMSSFSGVDPNKILLPETKERTADLSAFNNQLDGTADALDDVGDKANKAKKGLLSFDEVFRLTDKDKGTDAGENLNIDFPSISPGGMDSWTPEIPNFTEWGKDFATSLWKSLSGALGGLEGLISTLLGGLIGLGIGSLLGHPLIGAAIGLLGGWLWNKLADAFGLDPEQKVKAAISTGIGAAIGTGVGFVFGGPIGAKIGAVVGTLAGTFWGMVSQSLGVTDGQQISSAIGSVFEGALIGARSLVVSIAKNFTPTFTNGTFSGFSVAAGFSLKDSLLGALKTGIIGAVTGLAAGLMANALTAWIADELGLTAQDLANSSAGQKVGSITGSIVGLILGGPIGSIIGNALGTFGGAIVGEFWDYMSTTLQGSIIGGVAGLPTGALIGTLVGTVGGPLGAALGAAIGAALGAAIGAVVEHWDAIKTWGEETIGAIGDFFTGLGEGIGSAWETVSSAWDNIKTKVSESSIVTSVKESWGNIKESVTTAVTDIKTNVSTKWSDIKSAVSNSDLVKAAKTVWTDMGTAIGTVATDIFNGVSRVWTDISTAVETVTTSIWTTVESIWLLIRDIVVKVATEIWTAVSEKFNEMKDIVTEKVTEIWNSVSEKFNWVKDKITTVATDAYNKVKEKFTEIKNAVWNRVTEVYNKIKEKFDAVYTKIRDIVTNAYNKVKEQFTFIYDIVKEKVTGVYNSVKDAFVDAYNTLKTSIDNMYTAARDGVGNIYNTFTGFINNLWTNVFNKLFGWIDDGISKLRTFLNLDNDAAARPARETKTTTSSNSRSVKIGHAVGGVFNREHIARFAEGNKAEAIIPLENEPAMKPFVDAVAKKVIEVVAPVAAAGGGNNSNNNGLPVVYVQNMIADDRGLTELYRRMNVIKLQEEGRRV